MKQDPLKLYNDVDWPELRRDDNERVVRARACWRTSRPSTPRSATTCSKTAEPGVLYWVDPENKPQPHANGMRFLAAVGSQKAIPMLEKWADPKDKLAEARARSRRSRRTWATAQSALRYLGLDEGPGRGWQILEKQLHRRNHEARRLVGLAHAGRPHHPRHDAARARRRRVRRLRAVGRPEGVRRPREVRRGPDGERAGAHGGVLRALVGRDRRPDEGGREEGPRQQRRPTRRRTSCAAATWRRSSTARCPTRRRGSSTCSTPSVPDIEVRHQVARAIGMGGITREHGPADLRQAEGRRASRPTRRSRSSSAPTPTRRRAPSRRTTTRACPPRRSRS